jgi:hypothetical protein
MAPRSDGTGRAGDPQGCEGDGVQVPWGGRRTCRLAMAVASVGAALLGIVGTGAAASTGDPSSNTFPNPPFFEDCSNAHYDDTGMCVNATVQAIDNARGSEGVGAIVLPSNWYSLSPEQQLFVAVNLERTARGIPALSAMATALDQSSEQAAAQGQDPSPPSGFPAYHWGGNWAGGAGNPLEELYFWMYYDGPNSNNVDCQSAGQPGCWIHRHNVLLPMQCAPCVMGTGFSNTGWQGGPSWDALLVDTSGSPAVDYTWSQAEAYLPGNEDGPPGGAATSPASAYDSDAQASSAAAPPASAGAGHRMVETTGGVFDFGSDGYFGSVPGLGISVNDIIGLARTVDNGGYWLIGSDGGMFAFGDAPFYGSVPGIGDRVNNIVGFAITPDGRGYWMVGSDGGMFAFGDAAYRGSIPGLGRSVNDIVGFATTPDGGGYWMVGRSGEVWTFGDAGYYGSPWGSGIPVSNIVGMAATPGGNGYWLVGADGGVFGYGTASYLGSVPASDISVSNIVSIASSPDGRGYWMFGSDGGVFSFGAAGYFGSLPGLGIHVSDVRMGSGT